MSLQTWKVTKVRDYVIALGSPILTDVYHIALARDPVCIGRRSLLQ